MYEFFWNILLFSACIICISGVIIVLGFTVHLSLIFASLIWRNFNDLQLVWKNRELLDKPLPLEDEDAR